MTICPIAIAVGCKKCPAFSICPLKSKLGDFKKDVPLAPPVAPPTSARARRKRTK
ncbi:MAG TPA: hypothetical protein VGE16_03825 [Albitalea sp.]